MAMSEGNPTPEERDPQETGPAQRDPTALPGVEAAIGLATYRPVTFLGTKAVETICGDDRPDGISSTERVLGPSPARDWIALAGLFCPILLALYLTDVTGAEPIMHAGASGLIALAGLLLAGWYRVQLAGSSRTGKRWTDYRVLLDREEDPVGSPAGFRRIPGRHPSQITAIR